MYKIENEIKNRSILTKPNWEKHVSELVKKT